MLIHFVSHPPPSILRLWSLYFWCRIREDWFPWPGLAHPRHTLYTVSVMRRWPGGGGSHHICVNCTLLRLQTRGSHMTQNTAKWISGTAQPGAKYTRDRNWIMDSFPRTGSSSELEGAPLIIIGGMFKVGSKARTSWWSVCGQLWPGAQLPVLAVSWCWPLSSPCPGPGHPGHTQLPWLLATCVTPLWYNISSQHILHIQSQSIPTFPYFRKHQA